MKLRKGNNKTRCIRIIKIRFKCKIRQTKKVKCRN